jgi:hypothetical protein
MAKEKDFKQALDQLLLVRFIYLFIGIVLLFVFILSGCAGAKNGGTKETVDTTFTKVQDYIPADSSLDKLGLDVGDSIHFQYGEVDLMLSKITDKLYRAVQKQKTITKKEIATVIIPVRTKNKIHNEVNSNNKFTEDNDSKIKIDDHSKVKEDNDTKIKAPAKTKIDDHSKVKTDVKFKNEFGIWLMIIAIIIIIAYKVIKKYWPGLGGTIWRGLSSVIARGK